MLFRSSRVTETELVLRANIKVRDEPFKNGAGVGRNAQLETDF